jgi:hypothetical protein
MTGLCVRPLDEATWSDFARLVERHNGVWGGCWCMAFHAEGVGRTKPPAQNRSEKECRVREGRAHAALVYDGPTCVGWCALHEIARLGGGTVESYPEAIEGRSVSASFLHNGTVSMFERHGFERTRRLGKHHWVVAKVVRVSPLRVSTEAGEVQSR